MRLVEDAIAKGEEFKFRPSQIQTLHREALDGISGQAGNWRPAGVSIHGSRHTPIGAHLVAEAIEGMCDYINANWNSKSAIHLAAYAMWRLNWIHPFTDGNGRTSRIFSYVVLCARVGHRLPGTNTIPDQIVADRKPYFDALEAADLKYRESEAVDVSVMERLLESLLANQLAEVLKAASDP